MGADDSPVPGIGASACPPELAGAVASAPITDMEAARGAIPLRAAESAAARSAIGVTMGGTGEARSPGRQRRRDAARRAERGGRPQAGDQVGAGLKPFGGALGKGAFEDRGHVGPYRRVELGRRRRRLVGNPVHRGGDVVAGERPLRVIISKNTTAAENRSDRPSSDSPLTCSGDM